MQLLYLTNALLSRGDGGPAGPVPVVFHLSSWTLKRRSLSRWLVDELEIRYGVTRRLGEAWVRSRSIMPMLDGLDEVAEEHRADCVAAINVFLTVHGQLPVAVCCRTERYEALPVRLALRSAVVLQPLARADVERYLRGGGRSLIGVSAVLHDDEQLWGLLKTPLFLSVVGSTYRDRPPEALPATGEPGARRRRIVADYAEAMLNRPHVVPSPYGRDDTVRWLRWLASQMRSRGQSIFYPDLMQPDWLPSALARTVAMAGVTAGIVLGCALSGLMLAVVVQRAVGLLHLPVLLDLDAGLGPNPPWEVKLRLPLLALGPIIGAVNGALLAVLTHMTTIAPTERLRWYWPPPTRDLARTAAGVLIAVVLSTELGNEVGRFLGTVGFLLVVGLLLYFPDAERAREPDGRHGSLVPMAVAVVAASVLGLVLALQLAGSSGAQVVDLAETLPHRAVFGLVFTLTVGVALATLETRLQVVPQAPGEGMRRTRRSAVAAAGVAWLMVGVVVLLVDGLFFGPVTGAVDGLTIGAGAGMFVGLKRGGRAYLHHWAMRGVLTRMGVAPRDLVGFLDFASGLALLRRHGGGYEFIHSLVLDHFAGAGR